jgi:hypothetical protein
MKDSLQDESKFLEMNKKAFEEDDLGLNIS